METKYPAGNSRTPNSFEEGNEFQDFVADVLRSKYGMTVQYYTSRKYQIERGESAQGIEIKLDRRCTDTKRLSVETAEKTHASNAAYVASGIYRRDNTYLYVQGNFDVFFVFFKAHLIFLHQSGRYPEKVKPTLKAFYLPFANASRTAGIVYDPKNILKRNAS